MSIEWMARSPDSGQTWQPLVNFQHGRVNDWAVLNGQLYVAGQKGIGRWNETLQTWEYPMDGLPLTPLRIQMIYPMSPASLFMESTCSLD